MMTLEPLAWLIGILALLLVVQRRLHAEVQMIILLISRRVDITIALFSILFFPGILLHEGSHFLMARLLRVRTGRVSLLPRSMPDGRLQMGYVETSAADPLRETLIGAAPLIVGGLFTAYAGLYPLGLSGLWTIYQSQGLSEAASAVLGLTGNPDFWLWMYLTFVVSSTMLPSASDRRSWLPMAGVLGALVGIGLLAGVGSWAVVHAAPWLDRSLRALVLVFGISLGLHVVLVVPLYGFRKIVGAMVG